MQKNGTQKGNKAILITLYLKIITFVLVLFFIVAFSVIPDQEVGNTLSLLTVVLWGGANLAFIIAAIFALIDCFFCVLVTSIYSIGFTAGLKRFGLMTGGAAAGLIVMQVMFVLDMVAAAVLIATKRYKG